MPEVTRVGSVPEFKATTASAVQAMPARQVDKQEAQVPTEVPAEQKPAPDPLKVIARKEQALRQQQMALKAERDKLAQEAASRESERAELERLRAREKRLADDPYSVMLEAGLTADQVAAKLLNQPNPADQRVLLLEQEIERLKAANEQTAAKIDESAVQQRETAIKQIHADVQMMVDADPAFETIKAKGLQQAVTNLIVATYDEEGRMMSNEEAAKEVEDFLVEEALKDAQLAKVRARLQAEQPQQKQEVAVKTPGPQTLSNRMVPSTNKALTWAERRARAIAVGEGRQP